MNHTKFVLDKKNLVIEYKLYFYLSDTPVTFEIGQSHPNWNETTKLNMEVVILAELERLLVNTCHAYSRRKKANSSFCHIQPQMITLYPVRIVGATDFTGATHSMGQHNKQCSDDAHPKDDAVITK